jgi:NAD(P)H-hydrate epimerase
MLSVTGQRVVIVCGGGNNGGDGYVIARHLHLRGADVHVAALVAPDELRGDARVNADVWRALQPRRLTVGPPGPGELAAADLIVDAIFGTGLARPVTGDAADAIASINASGRPVLAVDLPSGLDCDTGEPLGRGPGGCVRAIRTVTFVAEKLGFTNPRSRDYTGEVLVADIGIPAGVAS